MTLAAQRDSYTLEEYLELERNASEPSEFVDGWLFPRYPISDQHNLIAGNLMSAFHEVTRGTKHAVYVSQLKVLIPGNSPVVYYPDLIVAERSREPGSYFVDQPLTIVEITSERTEYTDRREKKVNYHRLESVQTYLIVHQNQKRVEVCRRAEDGTWQTQTLENEGLIELECPNTTLTLEQMYEDVDFSSPKD